jgi:hypothetical protein
MKKILLPSLIVLIAIVAMSIVSAFNFGEKSPIYVKGKVRIDDELRDSLQGVSTMFVVIYDLDSPMPMPFGAMRERLSAEQLASGSPIPFMVTKEKLQMMNPNAPMPKRMSVKVRMDKDGLGGRDQPGDLTGVISELRFGASDVTVDVNELVKGEKG